MKNILKNLVLFGLLFFAIFFLLLSETTGNSQNSQQARPDASKVSKEGLLAFPIEAIKPSAPIPTLSAPIPPPLIPPTPPIPIQQTQSIVSPPIPPTPTSPPPSPSSSEVELAFGTLTTKITDPSHEQTVYLTFDDGPGNNTKKIVEILDQNNIRGSFFWVGENLEKWLRTDPSSSGFIQEMLKKGEVIGSHTMEHTALGHKSLQDQIQLIKKSEDYISEKINHPLIYFRPPYGSVDQNTPKASEATKQIMAYWQVDSEDWRYPHNPKKVMSNILNEVGPGAIILLHEKPTTIQMLQEIINILKAKGYNLEALPKPKI